MPTVEQIDTWVLAGKQVGATASWPEGEGTCWTSVAVQLWAGVFLVYIDEVLESKMASEDYERDELVGLESLKAVREFIASKARVNYSDLSPRKGQRIFNPTLYQP